MLFLAAHSDSRRCNHEGVGWRHYFSSASFYDAVYDPDGQARAHPAAVKAPGARRWPTCSCQVHASKQVLSPTAAGYSGHAAPPPPADLVVLCADDITVVAKVWDWGRGMERDGAATVGWTDLSQLRGLVS